MDDDSMVESVFDDEGSSDFVPEPAPVRLAISSELVELISSI